MSPPSRPAPPSLAEQLRELRLRDPVEKLLAQSVTVIFVGALAFGVLLSFSGSSSSKPSAPFFWLLLGAAALSALVYRVGSRMARSRRSSAREQVFQSTVLMLAAKGKTLFSNSCKNVIHLAFRMQTQHPSSAPHVGPIAEAFDALLPLMLSLVTVSERMASMMKTSLPVDATGQEGAKTSVQNSAQDPAHEVLLDSLENALVEISRLFIYLDASMLGGNRGPGEVSSLSQRALMDRLQSAEALAASFEHILGLEKQVLKAMQEVDGTLRRMVGQNEETMAAQAAAFVTRWGALRQKITSDFAGLYDFTATPS